MATPKPKRIMLPIERVIPNPRNDNIHPQSQIDLLVESIRRFGQPRPVLVRQANHMLIAGHGVWMAMRQAGELQIDAAVWDVDQRTADAFLVADNRHAELSRRDDERRRALLAEFTEDEFASLGFLAEEVEAMLAGPTPLTVSEIETGPVNDSFWISIHGPLAHQAVALKRISDLMADMPEVEVDLGTAVR
jgi:ParB-like chromosome segregation protein Spo0J